MARSWHAHCLPRKKHGRVSLFTHRVFLKHARCRGRVFTLYMMCRSNAVLSINILFKVRGTFLSRWDRLANYTFHIPIKPTLQIEFQKWAFSLFCNDKILWLKPKLILRYFCRHNSTDYFIETIHTQCIYLKLNSMKWGTHISRRSGLPFYCIAIFDFSKCL
jgi:hypothetical protein